MIHITSNQKELVSEMIQQIFEDSNRERTDMADETNVGQGQAVGTGAAAEAKIVIDGKEMTAKEVKEQMLMHADYTKKTQALAEEKKAIAAQAATLADAQALAEALQSNPDLEEEVNKVVEAFNKKAAGLAQGSVAESKVVAELNARLAAIESANQKAIIDGEMKAILGNIDAALDKEGIKIADIRETLKDSVLVKIMQGAGKDADSIGSFISAKVKVYRDNKLDKLLGIKPETTVVGDNGGVGGAQIGIKEIPLTHAKDFGGVMEQVLKNLTGNNQT